MNLKTFKQVNVLSLPVLDTFKCIYKCILTTSPIEETPRKKSSDNISMTPGHLKRNFEEEEYEGWV